MTSFQGYQHTAQFNTSKPLGDEYSLDTLLKQLAPLSQQKRWQLWIAPPALPCAEQLQALGIDTQHVLIIQAKQLKDRLQTLKKALKNGYCSAVLAWMEEPIGEELQELKRAAQNSKCHGYAFAHQGDCQALH
ncbi:SulA-like leucine-rich domain-containing protein [Dongshaea marina]|uniref:SulA-like leucine-rich domain-containing protein n=1 Tax=Dongshaea marina TaxID=2047966 RepID=UPI000D3ED13E|nr:SulA-like leucine-rich domain-containing protein [Dongshaea marina]